MDNAVGDTAVRVVHHRGRVDNAVGYTAVRVVHHRRRVGQYRGLRRCHSRPPEEGR